MDPHRRSVRAPPPTPRGETPLTPPDRATRPSSATAASICSPCRRPLAKHVDGKGTPQGTLAAAFAPGDVVLVRWRMITDGSDQGWGWALDNVSFQGGALPVELVSFTGAWDRQSVRLAWNTASETNNAFFAVERQQADETWAEVGRRTGASTVTEAQAYPFHDATVPLHGHAPELPPQAGGPRRGGALQRRRRGGRRRAGGVLRLRRLPQPRPLPRHAALRPAGRRRRAHRGVRRERDTYVTRLADGPMAAGRHEVTIDGRDFGQRHVPRARDLRRERDDQDALHRPLRLALLAQPTRVVRWVKPYRGDAPRGASPLCITASLNLIVSREPVT